MTDKDALALNWYRRLEIALGVAQGLEYLHTFAVSNSSLKHDGTMMYHKHSSYLIQCIITVNAQWVYLH